MPEDKKLEEEQEPSINGKKVPKEKYQKALEELEKAKADADHWKNEYYKVYADTQNLRKSLENDKHDAIRYRAAGFLEELLPALDSMYMALSIPPKNDEVKNYCQGFQFIYNQITNCLQNEGISELVPNVGDTFDATTMHAVDTVETEEEEGKIAKVYAKGYKLHDRLVRPAMVSVTKKKVEAKTEEVKEENKADETPAEDMAKA